jgi:RNA polymerase sigma factor (sigma-70 family)
MNLVMTNDETLFSEYLAGSEASFTVLYNRHLVGLWALIMSVVRDDDAADDLTQETFLKLHAHRAFRKGDLLKPWLHRIAFNAALEYRRKLGRNKTVTTTKAQCLPEEDVIGDIKPGVFEQVTSVEQRERVRTLMLKLPEKHQQTLALCYLEGMSRTQMAEVWKVPPDTMKRWLKEAHEAFEAVWKESV